MVVWLFVPQVSAQEGGVVRQGQSVVTRVYPIGDLLEATGIGVIAPRDPQAGRFGGGGGGGGGMGGGGGAFSQPTQGNAEAKRASEVADLLRGTVDSDSWRENGGTLGTLTYVPWTRSLVVTHTPATHEKLAALLQQLAPRTRMLTTRVMLAPLDADAMGQTEMRDGLLVYTGDASALKPVAQALLVGYDGEEQVAENGQTRTFVGSVQPVVAAGVVGYSLVMETVETGLSLRLTPRMAEGGERVRVRLSGRYTVLLALDDIAMPATRPGDGSSKAAGSYQVPQIAQSGIDARASLSTDQWTVVAGFGGDGDRPPLHLLVRIVASESE